MPQKIFTPEELTTIHELASAAAGVEARMGALDRHLIKDALASAGERYAAGLLALPEAILAAAGCAVVENGQVALELRRGCKNRLREIYAAADEFIRASDRAAVESAAAAAAALEKTERDIHTGHAGLPSASFEPSAALAALRRRHGEALAWTRRAAPATATDFARLLAALAITPPAPAPMGDP